MHYKKECEKHFKAIRIKAHLYFSQHIVKRFNIPFIVIYTMEIIFRESHDIGRLKKMYKLENLSYSPIRKIFLLRILCDSSATYTSRKMSYNSNFTSS